MAFLLDREHAAGFFFVFAARRDGRPFFELGRREYWLIVRGPLSASSSLSTDAVPTCTDALRQPSRAEPSRVLGVLYFPWVFIAFFLSFG